MLRESPWTEEPGSPWGRKAEVTKHSTVQLPLQGAQVQSLVRELRSDMPHNKVQKKEKEKESRIDCDLSQLINI